MKHTRYFIRFFILHISIIHLLLQCADSSQQDNRLDVMIPDDRFAIYLALIAPRDTAEASTVTAGTPNTWADSGTALLRYLSKNYTGKGRIEYVTNPDNPYFLRTLAEHVAQRRPLETKAQEEIIDTLDKIDARGCPTHEGVEAMLRIVDACYLVIPSMHLMIAKTYLNKYVEVYKIETLLNEHIKKELQFVPKLLAASRKDSHSSPIPIPEKSHIKERPSHSETLSIPHSKASVVPTILLDLQQSHEDSSD